MFPSPEQQPSVAPPALTHNTLDKHELAVLQGKGVKVNGPRETRVEKEPSFGETAEQ